MSREYYVYILTNYSHSVLYTGVTNHLETRVLQHKNKTDPKSFTAKYNVNKLVYQESTDDVEAALSREKQIKGWLRSKKVTLINSMNPEWRDLLD